MTLSERSGGSNHGRSEEATDALHSTQPHSQASDQPNSHVSNTALPQTNYNKRSHVIAPRGFTRPLSKFGTSKVGVVSGTASAAHQPLFGPGVHLNISKLPTTPVSTWALGSSILGVGSKWTWNSWRDHYKWHTLPFSHLPGWMRDNIYIHRGYRPQLNSVSLCLLSIFRLHYDTVNIWSHLLGIFLLLALMLWCFFNIDAPMHHKGLLSIFFATGMTCFFNSTIFHIFWVYSPRVSRFLNRLDYISIVLLIIGSFLTWMYYLLYCYTILQVVYMTTLSSLGVFTLIAFTMERFTRPRYRYCRAFAFVGLGISGILPLLHSMYLTGWSISIKKHSMGWLAFLACSYIGGATIYALRIPEKWWPGRFDLFFNSHQILHCSTLIAVCAYTRGIYLLMEYQINQTACLPFTWG